nr:MFS transporter [Streptomyces scopuliridis]
MEQTTQQPRDGRALPPSVLALAAATFCVVTTEMLPVGLLTSLGEGLRTSDGTTGFTLTLPGVVAALSAPLLPVAVRRADRRTVLCALLVLLAAANLLSALAPAFGVLLVARALVGVCIGGVWAVAAGLAVRLVRQESAGRATAVIFSGIAVASVLGVPAGTLMGGVVGWRWAFAAMTLLALAVAALLAVLLPPLPAGEAVRVREVFGLVRTPAVRTGLLVVALLVTGGTSPRTPMCARPWSACRGSVPGRSAGCCWCTGWRASRAISWAARQPPAIRAGRCSPSRRYCPRRSC